MPTGFRTYLNGVTVAGVTYTGFTDLESIFEPRGTATPAANTGHRAAGTDLAQRFYPLSAGGTQFAQNTGFRKAGADLRTIFAQKGTVSTGGGGSGGGGGCLPADTLVPLWAGGTRRMDELMPGDVVAGYAVEGMIDEEAPGWRDWTMPAGGEDAGQIVPVTVRCRMTSSYRWHYLINGDLRATYEHTFLIRRGDVWGWRRAEELQPGDVFLTGDFAGWPVQTIERVDAAMDVANVDVEETDTYLFLTPGGVALVSHNPEGGSNKV